MSPCSAQSVRVERLIFTKSLVRASQRPVVILQWLLAAWQVTGSSDGSALEGSNHSPSLLASSTVFTLNLEFYALATGATDNSSKLPVKTTRFELPPLTCRHSMSWCRALGLLGPVSCNSLSAITSLSTSNWWPEGRSTVLLFRSPAGSFRHGLVVTSHPATEAGLGE